MDCNFSEHTALKPIWRLVMPCQQNGTSASHSSSSQLVQPKMTSHSDLLAGLRSLESPMSAHRHGEICAIQQDEQVGSGLPP